MLHRPSPVRRDRSDAVLDGRRPVLRAALSAILLPVLGLPARSARAGIDLFANEFTATRAELQAELARRFPITRRYGELASVSLHDPRLALDGEAHRVALTSRLAILSLLLRPSPLGGQLAVSSGLRWDAPGLSVRLQDPRVEQLRLDGVAGSDAQQLERITAAVAQEALQGYPLHTFRPEEIPFGLRVRSLTIGTDEIKVEFE